MQSDSDQDAALPPSARRSASIRLGRPQLSCTVRQQAPRRALDQSDVLRNEEISCSLFKTEEQPNVTAVVVRVYRAVLARELRVIVVRDSRQPLEAFELAESDVPAS